MTGLHGPAHAPPGDRSDRDTCDVEDGTATVEGSTGSDRSYAGSYDSGRGELVLDGVRYWPVEES